MFRPILLVASLTLAACAPSIRQIELGRIEHRLQRAEYSPRDQAATLSRALSAKHLHRSRLVRAVLAQNPSLTAARAAWRAAAERVREKDAVPDPVLSYTLAPASIFDPAVRFGQIVQLSQTIPWLGKTDARAAVELHRAEMRAQTYAAARAELALRACRLFDRYYVVARAIEINREHQKLVQQLGKAIEAHYATGQGTLYEPLQIETVRAHLEHEAMGLRTDRQVIRAELNALLHRAPAAPLPPPPARIAATPSLPQEARAEALALARRPELRRAEAEHESLEASLDATQRDYLPDFTLFASYNSMWAMLSHQFMFGISAPLPILVDRRQGAEAAARASLSENESQQEALTDQVQKEVFEARARLLEAVHVVELYEKRLVPLANQQAEAVRPAFAAGDVSFAEVLAVERGRWTVVGEWHQALAMVNTRRAELEWATGTIPGIEPRGEQR